MIMTDIDLIDIRNEKDDKGNDVIVFADVNYGVIWRLRPEKANEVIKKINSAIMINDL